MANEVGIVVLGTPYKLFAFSTSLPVLCELAEIRAGRGPGNHIRNGVVIVAGPGQVITP